MRLTPRWFTAAAMAAVALVGCSGGSKSPATPSPQGTGDPIDLLENTLFEQAPANVVPVGETALGGARLTVDMAGMSASVAPLRSGTATDDSYHLSVQNFLTARHIAVDRVTATATDIVVDYTISHPFPGPTDVNAAPNGFSNRADLGITGRTVILADVSSATGNTFFTDVVANTDLVALADGYVQPRGLIPQTSSMTANAFPFMLLVDEALGTEGSRVGISNGGNPLGNYRADQGGWQATNIVNGTENNGWTGYDYLHQGQSSRNSLTLRRTALTGGPVSLDMVVLAKYTDPRGGTTSTEKRANRLPETPTFDTNKFVYRLPYAALDVARARFRGESGGLLPNQAASASTVRVTVRDWDARAQVTSRADLSQDPIIDNVEPGGPGVPTVDVDVPGVTASPVSLTLNDDDTPLGAEGDAAPETGYSNDPLYFQGALVNTAGVGGGQTPGDKRGMIRVTDISNSQDRSAYEFQLDPDLNLLTSNKMDLQIFQTLDVNLGGVANDPPNAAVEIQGGANPQVASGGNVVFMVLSESDTEGDTVLYDVDTEYTGTFNPDGNDIDPPAVPGTLYTGTAPINTGTTNLMRTARVAYFDAAHVGTPTFIDLPYEVLPAGANVPPTVTIQFAEGVNPTIASGGTLTLQVTAESDPDADPVNYSIVYNCVGACTTPDVPAFDPPGTAPFDLHTTPPLTNPGPGPSARTMRVRYWDPLRAGAPLVVNLPYTISDPSCATATQQYTFDSGIQGWQPGGYGLPNTDAFGWGGWSWGCTNTSVETAASGGFAPGYLSHTQDGGASVCSYPEDYGGSANFNIVSPLLQVPTLCGANQVSVTFNYVMYARATATVKIYTSTTNGCSWVAHGSPIIGTGAVQAANNQTITFTGISAGQNLLVRFEFVDTDPVEFNFPASNPFGGIWLDNIRINATSAGTWTPGTPPPPPANYYTDNFEATPTNWSTYGLPQTDAAVAQGGACGFPGPWGGWGVCTATIGQASGNAMTAGGDGGLCNAYSYDMAHTSDFNIVSPAFSLVGVSGTVSIELDEIIGVDQYPWTTTVYMANNPPMGNPTAWGTPVLTYAHTVSESLGTTRLTATVPAALVGQSQVRIRVQVTTPPANPMPDICNGSEGYTVSTSDWIGFDNLRVGAPTCP